MELFHYFGKVTYYYTKYFTFFFKTLKLSMMTPMKRFIEKKDPQTINITKNKYE